MIHDMSQNKLKGIPQTMGSIRSHSETEKHMAAKGISPSNKAPIDGLLAATYGIRSSCFIYNFTSEP
jgi:hypothetical protein